MAIKHFTNKNASQILATQSRRADISAIHLCSIHFEMGKYLAYQMLDDLELVETEIHHVQGLRKGIELLHKNNIATIAIMRAGLYAAEGIRSVFTESLFILENNDITDICKKIDFQDKIVIVIDAVINTGRSMIKIIESLEKCRCKRIIVATLILQKEALLIFEKYQNISFYALRISENKYVGKGGTDTGNRLFNTFALE